MKKIYNNFTVFKLLIFNNFKNIMEIFKLKKLILNFGIKKISYNSKLIIPSFLALFLISENKPSLRYSNKATLVLKIKKGQVVGCKTTLRNYNLNFITLVLLENVFSNLKDMNGLNYNSTSLNCLTFGIEDLFIFKKIDFFFEIFTDLPNLNVTLVTNSTQKEKMFNFMKILGI